jgi:hypothetical protein
MSSGPTRSAASGAPDARSNAPDAGLSSPRQQNMPREAFFISVRRRPPRSSFPPCRLPTGSGCWLSPEQLSDRCPLACFYL